MQREITEKWLCDKRMRRQKKRGQTQAADTSGSEDLEGAEQPELEDNGVTGDNMLKEINEDEREETDDSDVAMQPKFNYNDDIELRIHQRDRGTDGVDVIALT